MRRMKLAALLALLLAPSLSAAGEFDRPLPQNPARQRQRVQERLAWGRRTLGDAYEKVGKKDPKWDKQAREALEAAAHLYAREVEPVTPPEKVFAPAKKAVDSGCDDPMILYLFARTTPAAAGAGADEIERRFKAASEAMERSSYPLIRRQGALNKTGLLLAAKKDDPAAKKKAAGILDACLKLLAEAYPKDADNPDVEAHWFETLQTIAWGFTQTEGGTKAAFDRIDGVLSKNPGLKALRLKERGKFYIDYAWEARGNAYAPLVAEKGFKMFHERLAEAGKALKGAWALKPGDARIATMMIMVELGIGGERADMEKWFSRAMEADGDNYDACMAKLNWLEPKWHGSVEDLIAFGRACRDTKNWRAKLTTVVGVAHRHVMPYLEGEAQERYMRSPEVWNDIRPAYEEYLKHVPSDNQVRSEYAGLGYLCGQAKKSYEQFQALGENVVYGQDYPEDWMKQARSRLAAAVSKPAGGN